MNPLNAATRKYHSVGVLLMVSLDLEIKIYFFGIFRYKVFYGYKFTQGK